jgi:exoribonuclease R
VGTRVLEVKGAAVDELRRGVDAIQQEQKLSPEFPPDVEMAARAAAQSPRLPARDLTEVEFLTIDPVGAMDLDQPCTSRPTASGSSCTTRSPT